MPRHAPNLYTRNTIALTLKAWYHRMFKRQKPGHCLQCGYDTTGLTRYPECGAPIPNEKPAAT